MDKRRRVKIKTVATHSGKFHADDVFAVATLKIYSHGNLKVMRTRDQQTIEKADWVVDVGNVYNRKKNRFDHHQPKGAGKRKNGVPYASFGLVWKKYGKSLCGSKKVADYIDKKLVQQIDAKDNGFNVFKMSKDVYPYTISDAIAALNLAWDEKGIKNKAFTNAVSIAQDVLQREIKLARAKQRARKYVLNSIKNTNDKRIVVLNRNYPWKEFIMPYQEPLFVVYPDSNGWVVAGVRKNLVSFKIRRSFPKSWTGKREKQFAKISGVKDAVFCHRNLFMAVAKSRKGAIQLAKIALGEE
jgi:uncharacterized UPF0160 family protein